MEKYYRMVIDLYKEVITTNYQVNSDRILEVRKEIACAITEAKVTGTSYSYLDELLNDIDYLNK